MQEREMLTGHHVVRDVLCKNCDTILGWFYEFASDDAQRWVPGSLRRPGVRLELQKIKFYCDVAQRPQACSGVSFIQ